MLILRNMPIRAVVIKRIHRRPGTRDHQCAPAGASGIYVVSVRKVQQVESHLLLALSMKVDAFDAARDLIERDVVEAFEACSTDSLDSVVRD